MVEDLQKRARKYAAKLALLLHTDVQSDDQLEPGKSCAKFVHGDSHPTCKRGALKLI